MFKNGMRPIHPGEVLREDYLVPLQMSVNALAKALFWLGMQTDYDLRITEIKAAKRISTEVKPRQTA